MASEFDYNISIIIPTINREKSLEQTLLDLKNQKQVSFEVLIIHQSPLRLLKLENYSTNFSFINSPIQSASSARNIGILNSKANILLFIDDDVLIDDEYFVYKHFRHYSNNTIPGVIGRSLEKDFNTTTYSRPKISFNKDIGFFYFPKNYGSSTFLQAGRSNNLSVRRAISLEIGGMDENYTRGAHREETDFCLRVSNKFGAFLYDPKAKLIHLNESAGGIRSWDENNLIKSEHNMVGSLYFYLKMAPLFFKPEFLFDSLRYLFLNKTILSKPNLYILVFKRVAYSFFKAYRLYKSGPNYLNKK